VIPFISGEEEKIETETRKILARSPGRGRDAPGEGQRAHEPRAGVGRHTETVSVALEKKPSSPSCARPSRASRRPQRLGLPFAPERPVLYLDQPNRPQPRFDAGRGRA